ncbi:MAG: glycosyltransferase family 2 protein [Mycoplasmatales bacterium]
MFYNKYKRLLEIEKKYNLYEVKYMDEYVWPYFRNKIYGILHKENFEQTSSTNIISQPQNYFDSTKNLFDYKVQTDVLIFNFNRFVKDVDGKIVDEKTNYFKKMCEEQKINFIEIAHSNESNYSLRNDIFNISDCHDYYNKLNSSFKVRKNEKLKEISKVISEELEIEFNYTGYIREITAKIESYHLYYEEVFKRLKPKLIVLTSNYMRNEIIIPAKKLRIPIIELQYAAITKYHNGYHYNGNENKLYPDYIFTYGRYFSGFKYFPSTLKGCRTIGIDVKYEKTEKQNVALVISQNLISKEMIRHTLKLKEANPNLKIVFRKHPNENLSFETIRDFENAGIILSKNDLQTELNEAKYVVGSSSTVLYDAFENGCNVILVDTYLTGFSEDMIENKIGQMISSDYVLETMKFNSVSENYKIFEKPQDIVITEYFKDFEANDEKNEKFHLKFMTFRKKQKYLDLSKTSEFISGINKPILTIIVPMYNCETTILRTIKSINQLSNKKSFQVFLVDDHSKDNSFENVEKYLEEKKLSNFSLWKTGEPSGCAAGPRNYALAKTTTKYVSFLDADDEMNALNIEYGLFLMESKKLDIVKFGVLALLNERRIIYPIGKNREIHNRDFEYLKASPFVWNHIYRNDLIQENSLKMREGIAEDFNFNLKYSCYVHKGFVFDAIGVVYYKIDSNMSLKNDFKNVYKLLGNAIDSKKTVFQGDKFNRSIKKYVNNVIIEKYCIVGVNIYELLKEYNSGERTILLERLMCLFEVNNVKDVEKLISQIYLKWFNVSLDLKKNNNELLIKIIPNIETTILINDKPGTEVNEKIEELKKEYEFKILEKNIYSYQAQPIVSKLNDLMYVVIKNKNGKLKIQIRKINENKIIYFFERFFMGHKINQLKRFLTLLTRYTSSKIINLIDQVAK